MADNLAAPALERRQGRQLGSARCFLASRKRRRRVFSTLALALVARASSYVDDGRMPFMGQNPMQHERHRRR